MPLTTKTRQQPAPSPLSSFVSLSRFSSLSISSFVSASRGLVADSRWPTGLRWLQALGCEMELPVYVCKSPIPGLTQCRAHTHTHMRLCGKFAIQCSRLYNPCTGWRGCVRPQYTFVQVVT